MDTSWTSFQVEVRAAVEGFVRGAPEPYKRCWSTREDCTIFGAFGGVVTGPTDIRSRLDWVAAQYTDGQYTRFEVVAEAATQDLAYLAHLERIDSPDEQGHLVSRERRVTHVARREDDGWRLVHQHSDPLVQVTPPS